MGMGMGMGDSDGSLMDLSELLKRCNATGQQLLINYVSRYGMLAAKMMRTSVETPNWLAMREPTEVRAECVLLLEQAFDLGVEVADMLGTAAAPPRRRETRPSASAAAAARRATAASGKSGLQLDMGRLLASRRVQLYEHLDFSRSAVVVAVLQVAFKSLFECVRLQTFGKFGYQQLQVDAHFFRASLPRVVEDASSLTPLLDEVLRSASERCLDPTPLEHSIVLQLCRERFDSLSLNVDAARARQGRASEEESGDGDGHASHVAGEEGAAAADEELDDEEMGFV
eukprot:PLAT3292.16.p1 GENE.PLAT3292.16~~PLAT3292.16.p1  ORF type:complete len:285 (-),score=160.19 PLAT3292.16:57-911(-)